MKTNNLKTLAASFNLYQVNDIPERYRHFNFEHRINISVQPIPEIFNILNGYESGLFYECKQDTDYKGITTYYIEHSYVLVKKDNSDFVLMLRYSKNKYWLHPYYSLLHKYHNISYDIKSKALKELKEPNQIGVFSEKKISDWCNYCIEYINILDTTLTELNNENKAIQDSIDNFIQSVKGCKVSKYQNITDVTTNLFDVRFTHYIDQKYVNTKIVFTGCLKDIVNIESKKVNTPINQL